MNKARVYKLGLLVLCILFGLQNTKGQSLHIIYDFLKDDITFYRTKPGEAERKEIASPVVGRNKLVTVEVVNFNKFVYAADATYVSKVVETQSDMGFLDIVSPLVNPLGSSGFFSALGGQLPTEIGRGGVLASRGASTAYDDILDAYNKLSAVEQSMKSVHFAIDKLNKLKYNPYLPTDTIVRLSSTIVSQIFNKNVMNPSDFSEVISRFNTQYTNSMASFKMASTSFLREYSNYAKSRDGSFEGIGLDETVRGFSKEIETVSKSFNIDYITNQIDYLETVYTSIISTSFSFNSSHAAKDDEIDLTLNFYKLPQNEKGEFQAANRNGLDALSKLKEKSINIIVRGDIKVSTSIGMAFPTFGASKEYIYRDSSIREIDGSTFSPNLGAYVNVYPYTGRTFQLGGSFGVGVPLQEEQKNVNMFMGFSMLFGSDSRVALHGGASLGQVKVLGAGYSLGDRLDPTDAVIPLRNVWEWGTFIGVSFNIAKAGN